MSPTIRHRGALLLATVALLALARPAAATEAALPASATATLAALPAPGTATDSDEALPFKLSLPTQEDHEAWRTPGFRLQLGAGYGHLAGLSGAPSGTLYAFLARAGARLDADWSLFGSFQYAAALGTPGLGALRFAVTVDPTWHVTEHIDLAAGLGFGGIVEGNTDRADPDPAQAEGLVDSYTYPDARTPLPSCSGTGVAGLLRAGWSTALGPVSSTGIALELDGQWTGCVDDLGRVEPDTARPIVRRQWWPHVGGTVSWVVAWR